MWLRGVLAMPIRAITLRVHAHIIRKSADGVVATFAAAVTVEPDDGDQGYDVPDASAMVAG